MNPRRARGSYYVIDGRVRHGSSARRPARAAARILILLVVALGLAASLAEAAMPKPGRTYAGLTAKHARVVIVVNRRPTRPGVYTGTFSYCGYKVGIHIVHGHFGAWKKTAGGAVSVFRAYGSFKTPALAQGRIDLDFTSGCDGLPAAWTAQLR